MQTVKVKGHGEFSATAKMVVRFDGMKKADLVKMIAAGYEGHKDGSAGVGFWRTLPKETLVVVAADMFATDEERAKTKPVEQPPVTAAAPVPPEPTPERAPIVAPAGGYRLRCTGREGWLRRDQPRKPGEKPTWKRVEDATKASIYKTQRQAEAKLAEVASLYDDRDHQVELEAVTA
jgi:hypothetical protein